MLSIEDLKSGDIILFKGDNTVKKAQFILSLNPTKWLDKGSISTVHAGIVVSTNKQFFLDCWDHSFKLAHANQGVKTEIFRKNDRWRGTPIYVYRFCQESYAKEAASVAERWTSGNTTMPYAHFSKLVGAAFHYSGYTKEAQKRAKFYAEHKNTLGGPPGIAQDKKSMYCSMFVIACYQAVFGESKSSEYMPLDAKNTSPMTLESWLKGNRAWHFIGTIDL